MARRLTAVVMTCERRERGALLRRLVKCLLSQRLPDGWDMELLVIDGPGSMLPWIADLVGEPGTPRVRYWRMPTTTDGMGSAQMRLKRNVALHLSTGEYVVWADDDDWRSDDSLRRQLECILHRRADMCSLDVTHLSEIHRKEQDARYYALDGVRCPLFSRKLGNPGTMMVRRMAMLEGPGGGFPNTRCEDVDMANMLTTDWPAPRDHLPRALSHTLLRVDGPPIFMSVRQPGFQHEWSMQAEGALESLPGVARLGTPPDWLPAHDVALHRALALGEAPLEPPPSSKIPLERDRVVPEEVMSAARARLAHATDLHALFSTLRRLLPAAPMPALRPSAEAITAAMSAGSGEAATAALNELCAVLRSTDSVARVRGELIAQLLSERLHVTAVECISRVCATSAAGIGAEELVAAAAGLLSELCHEQPRAKDAIVAAHGLSWAWAALDARTQPSTTSTSSRREATRALAKLMRALSFAAAGRTAIASQLQRAAADGCPLARLVSHHGADDQARLASLVAMRNAYILTAAAEGREVLRRAGHVKALCAVVVNSLECTTLLQRALLALCEMVERSASAAEEARVVISRVASLVGARSRGAQDKGGVGEVGELALRLLSTLCRSEARHFDLGAGVDGYARTWPDESIVYYTGRPPEPWGPQRLATGLGGAETAVLHLAANWVALGREVSIYLAPSADEPSSWSGPEGHHWRGVRIVDVRHFHPRDTFGVLIIWRSAELLDLPLRARVLLLDLHDVPEEEELTDLRMRRLEGGGLPGGGPVQRGIVVRSPFHGQLLPSRVHARVAVRVVCNGFDPSLVPRGVGVRAVSDTQHRQPVVIYASAYDRGLEHMVRYGWPAILAQVPEAELHVYYGWQSHKAVRGEGRAQAERERIDSLLASARSVKIFGRVGQRTLLQAKREAVVHYYVGTWPEVDCISVRESAAAGCIPVTSTAGVFSCSEKGYSIRVAGDAACPDTQRTAASFIARLLQDKDLERCTRAYVLGHPGLRAETWPSIARRWLREVIA